MVGRATLTTVESRKAMLEPSTVAASTQRPEPLPSRSAGLAVSVVAVIWSIVSPQATPRPPRSRPGRPAVANFRPLAPGPPPGRAGRWLQLGPAVAGLVAGHPLDVALGHPLQRGPAVQRAVQRVHRLALPGGPGPPGQAALLDDAQQPLGVGAVHAPLAQALP